MLYFITCDIAAAQRREDVATVLSGYGPRVQLSMFEYELPDTRDAVKLRSMLRGLSDPVEDQIRVYPLDQIATASRLVLALGVGLDLQPAKARTTR